MAPSWSNLQECHNFEGEETDEAIMLDPSEIKEEINSDGDTAMDSGPETEDTDDDKILQEIQLNNDSCAYFDLHKSSIFCIAQHPLVSSLVATGGSEGDDAGGIGYVFNASGFSSVLPSSYQSSPGDNIGSNELKPIFKLEGHTDSICAMVFTIPRGEVLLSGGLDGKLRAYVAKQHLNWTFLGEIKEVEEINWLASCPNQNFANVIAFGADDGSVWVYSIDPNAEETPFQLLKSYFLHMESCTAGSWSPDGNLLATVSEDGSLYVWDVFGEGAATGLTQGEMGTYVVGLTASDQRFSVDGGLFSVAVSPNGTFLAVGGSGGSIKVVSLPRLGINNVATSNYGRSKGKDGEQSNDISNKNTASTGQAGQILADLKVQTDGIETLTFSSPPLSLMAAGSVDGSIAIFDTAHKFTVRRLIKEAHQDYSVVKVEFVKSSSNGAYFLTSCGMDGVVRRWDTRGGTGTGLTQEWKGHRGEGEGGGVLDFVQGDGLKIITAGDDGISLVFDSPI